MKNKKMTRFALISTLVVGGALAITAVFGAKAGVLAGRGTDGHDANCQWNHYDAVEATYDDHGTKEFWACCTHVGQFTLTEPTEGHITDQGPLTGEYFDNMDPADERYLPQLEGGNAFARLDIIGWQEESLLWDVEYYENILSVTMKVRVSEEYTSWIGFTVNTDHSNWNGLCNFSTLNDNEWHLLSYRFGGTGVNGYVNFSYNLDHVQPGYIDVDDITIVTSTGVFVDNFSENITFDYDLDHVSFHKEAPYNRFLREDAMAIDEEQCMVYSAEQ